MIHSQPLRVALVTRSLMTGGAQRHIVKLCQTVDPERVSLSVFLLIRDEPDDLVSQVPSHVPVYVSPYRRHHPLVLKWLADNWRRLDVQIVHSFLWTADAFASLAVLAAPSARLIISERGDRGDPRFYTLAKQWYDRVYTFHRAVRACANSQFGRRLLVQHGCPDNKARVIPNGIDLAAIDALPRQDIRSEMGWPDSAVVVGMVSRLVDYKAVDVFVHAMASLAPSTPVYAVVVGDGPLRSGLTELIVQLGLSERVKLVGRKINPESWVKDFDIGVLMTRTTEHCSNSILEYMVCSKPVVATALGGNSELITDGATGWLVSRDDVSGVTGAIRRLLDEPAAAAAMGRRGRERIQSDFALNSVCERFVALWTEAAQ